MTSLSRLRVGGRPRGHRRASSPGNVDVTRSCPPTPTPPPTSTSSSSPSPTWSRSTLEQIKQVLAGQDAKKLLEEMGSTR